MSCLLTLAASWCLMDVSQLTLRADVSTALGGDFRYIVDGRDMGRGHVGRVQLDMPLVSYRGFRLVAGVEHSSLVDTGRDRGQERAFVGFTYRIFGGAQ